MSTRPFLCLPEFGILVLVTYCPVCPAAKRIEDIRHMNASGKISGTIWYSKEQALNFKCQFPLNIWKVRSTRKHVCQVSDFNESIDF